MNIASPLAAPISRRLLNWLLRPTGRKAYKSWLLRNLVHTGFLLVTVVVGVLFYRFVQAAAQGNFPLPDRPASVEGFLPISGIMGLKHWWLTGSLNTVHPAATIILVLALVLSLFLRKSFCSWICSVGWLSEKLAALGRRIFGRNFRLTKWADVPLRALKYLLLGFFGNAIWHMGAVALGAFIDSPYNRVADVKLGLFFVNLGGVGLGICVFLVVASMFVQGAWCRYLCPYGALLGIFSRLSPVRIQRDPISCTDCGLCDKVCMSRLPVSTSIDMRDAECTGCLDCLAVCPAGDALALKAGPRRMPVWTFAALLLALYLGGYAGARTLGLWDSAIGDLEHAARIQNINSPEYGHPGSGGRSGR
jgi:polyferredoxin